MAAIFDPSPYRFTASPDPHRSPLWVRAISGLGSDFRHAFRQLAKDKGLSAVMLATLALCIGLTTAIFSMVHALLLRPLPFREPGQIVELYNSAPRIGLNNMPSNIVQYLDYTRNASSYETLALWGPFDGLFGEDGLLEPMRGARVTFEIFPLLGIQPILGDFFTRDNSRPGEDRVAILTQAFWKTQFNEDPNVIGRSLRIDGENLRIVGVAPQEIEALDARIKFFRPLVWSQTSENPNRRYSLNTHLYGRLKSGVPISQAAAEAALIENRYYEVASSQMRQFVDHSGIKVDVGGMRARRVALVRAPLYLLQAGAGFVLLIGCVNVASLLLIRANARQSDLAVRAALGATSGMIARQLFVESFTLTGIGALLGTALAWNALHVINRFTAGLLPHALPTPLDARILGFAIALTTLIGFAIGLAPVIHTLRTNISEVIQRGARAASLSRGVRSLSSILVVTQMAVALMLLAGAGLLIRSFANALRVDAGFDASAVVTARVAFPRAYLSTVDAAITMRERLIRSLKETPGVTEVGLGLAVPFRGGLGINTLAFKNDPLPPGSAQPGAFRVFVTPGYMEALQLRLIEGRFLNDTDMASSSQSYVIDESMAKTLFPDRSAVGEQMTFGDRPATEALWGTIVGVVGNVPHNGVEEKSGNPFVYQAANFPVRGYTVFLRTKRPIADLSSEIRNRVNALDPAIPIFDIKKLQAAVDESFENRRGIMLLLVVFALFALFLAALGIYGMLAYDVLQRTRDIGIRCALGATHNQIAGMIFKEGFVRAAFGLILGIFGTSLASRYMESLLFGVRPTDPVAYCAVSAVLLGVALLASYFPARRASQIDPVDALRAG